tara:strand:- start:189 stop:386 length:198 start_codon:yes stop_codon:yes gene_type:complete
LIPIILSNNSILNPFITDITIIKVPTPKTIPKKENKDIIETIVLFLLGFKYLKAMNKDGKLEIIN